jgi:hypothetical protein
MTQQSQKILEQRYAIGASKELNENWHITIPPDEKNWPDLVVEYNGNEFGLEVREVFLDEKRKGSQNKADEIRNERDLRALVEYYYSKISLPIKADFSGDIAKKETIGDSIIENVKGLTEFERININPYPGCKVSILKLPLELVLYDRWEYLSDLVGWVRKIDKKNIELIIEEKAKKLPKYLKNLSGVSLLLVSNRIKNSGKIDLEENIIVRSFGFKKIYFYSSPFTIKVINC